jgi:hypothetical protein
MSERPIDFVLSRLKNVKRSGDGYQASCPCHNDQSPSLSISEGSDGRVLLKCFAGCAVDDIVRAIGLTLADLFVKKNSVITVANLAADKGIPEAFLRSLGLVDREDGVVIPYMLPNGSIATRKRLRTALRAKNGSLWLFGKGKPVPYGLDRLEQARRAGFVVLVEGESDCWTLWHHGFPALGIPGADMTGKLEQGHLSGIAKAVVVHEPGKGGDTFTRGLAKRFRVIGFKGHAAAIGCGDFKDPNDLHRANPDNFKSAFQTILDAASVLKDESRASDGSSSPGASSEPSDPLDASGILTLAMNPSLDRVESCLRRVVELVSDDDDLARRVVRGRLIQHLTTLGVAGPSGLVDAAMKTVGNARDTLQGRSVILEAPDPWSDPVDGAELLDEMVAVFERYVVLPPGAAVAIAAWTLFTHALEAFTVAPMLALTSPEKRCGKTTTLDVVGALVPRKLPAANISPAALYRTVETVTPTLLVDEADAFLNRNEDLRGILNAGHTRSTAVVIRTVGDDHEPRQFSTWCPKLIASIGKLAATIEDRSIVVAMRRRASGEKVVRLRRDRIDRELEVVRSKAARWATDHLEELREADPAVPDELHDRAQDNWRPLFAIADIVSGEWPVRMRNAALALHGRAAADDDSIGVQLLADIQTLFQGSNDDVIASEVIVKKLLEIADRPWADFAKGHGLNQYGLARLLRKFEVRSRSVRTDGKTPKGYRRADLEDAFARYLPQHPQHPQQAENEGLSGPSTICNTPPSVADAETPKKEQNDGVVADVADAKPEDREGNEPQPHLPFESMPAVEEWEL